VEAALFQALNKFADEGPEPAAVEASINRLVYEEPLLFRVQINIAYV
jgi:hypothetical protein